MRPSPASVHIDKIPDLVSLRTNASRFFTILIWLHVPVVLAMAVSSGVDWRPQAVLLAVIGAITTAGAILKPASMTTRILIALALTMMPILFVFDNPGPFQVDYHMYFFVVYAMLVAFCDWRPIVVSAALTAVHQLLFNYIAPDRVFPDGGGLTRVALHAITVGVECGVLIWAIAQMRKLFMTAETRKELADASAERVALLERITLTDSLTQLGNHRAYSDDFAREVSRSNRHGHALTLALIDVDDFKALNDEHGHRRGDEVLALLARLFGTLRREDRAYRVDGDEFAIVFVETGATQARAVLDTLLLRAQNALLGSTISIGYVNLVANKRDYEPYELAEAALDEAKRRGRNSIVSFDEIKDHTDVFSGRKATIVRRLIDEKLVSTAFQPIWDIRGRTPIGFEALSRPNVELGLDGPAELFATAGRSRLLPALDRCCIRKAFTSSVDLPPGSTIFVNMTPELLEHDTFNPELFVKVAGEAGLRPEQVVIELTERRISDTARLVGHANILTAAGVRFALDDTGTGHAGLDTLTKMHFAFVKIDQSLIKRALVDRAAHGVLAGIIAIAQETGSYLIAEGIEDETLLDFVCDTPDATKAIRGVQGYLLGRPRTGRVDVKDLQVNAKFLASHFVKLAS